MTFLEQLEMQYEIYVRALDKAKSDRERCTLLNAIVLTGREIRKYKERTP